MTDMIPPVSAIDSARASYEQAVTRGPAVVADHNGDVSVYMVPARGGDRDGDRVRVYDPSGGRLVDVEPHGRVTVDGDRVAIAPDGVVSVELMSGHEVVVDEFGGVAVREGSRDARWRGRGVTLGPDGVFDVGGLTRYADGVIRIWPTEHRTFASGPSAVFHPDGRVFVQYSENERWVYGADGPGSVANLRRCVSRERWHGRDVVRTPLEGPDFLEGHLVEVFARGGVTGFGRTVVVRLGVPYDVHPTAQYRRWGFVSTDIDTTDPAVVRLGQSGPLPEPAQVVPTEPVEPEAGSDVDWFGLDEVADDDRE